MIAARMPMIAITVSSSIRVKALRPGLGRRVKMDVIFIVMGIILP
jgi:hypothetical protein